ncbi:MAG TPA: MurR/RpiR family transcriptional regulator [Pseudomonas sp.]|uniref:MurR/RpiR family transcriptional regulator n=1 Tax=Pseudomonas sp. TaxID=306 RepID=UPI002ED80732
MDRDLLCAQLKQQFDTFPRQERTAASFILDNSHEVAVMSMRDLARLANVPPSTMTRLAKRVGLSGYDELRELFIASLRGNNAYGPRAHGLVQLKQRVGEHQVIEDMANNAIEQIQSMCNPENLDSISRAVALLAGARQVYCLGMRSSFGVAFQFSHVASYFAKNVRLVEGAGESGVMSIINQTSPKDVALVCSLPRYSRRLITLTNYLHQQGVRIIAITDSVTSPTARLAAQTIIVKNQTPSFYDTIVPAMLVSEMLVALMSAHSNQDAEASVTHTEEKLLGLGEWWDLD